MDVFLALLAIVLAFLLYAAWQLLRLPRNRPAPRALDAATALSRSPGEERRRQHWITSGQLREVLAKENDLLLVDLRPDSNDAPPVLPAHPVLRVRTHQLEDVLRSLPADRSAVFYGASGLCVFMIQTSSCMRGTAPLYLLRAERHVEAA
ncbi:MAG TPA: hypothetical protein VHX37_06310 [Acidobacteriaceae bacterium]|jgi:hypothetical protein|nr:hypothetical protein [Acidobacteriaceae bacterium]